MDSNVNAITDEQLAGIKAGSILSGVLLVQSYSEKTTKTGKPYIDGILQSGTSTLSFKCWNNSSAYTKLHSEEYSGVVSYVSGEVQEYQGMLSMVVSDVAAVDGFDVSLFLKKRYNVDSYWVGLRNNYMSSIVSSKCMGLFDKIFSGDVLSTFKREFAASGHHDNCLGGLLAHTYKMVMLGGTIPKLYPSLFTVQGETEKSQDKVDIFMLGICIHDIGKIMEMHLGVYQPCSRVTHRILGIEMIEPYKADIIEAYGEVAYYDLVSILVQHHDEYDDKARTVVAYAVFLLDNMESKFMGLQQEVEERVMGTGDDARVRFDDHYLYL